jgi:glycosyltransferase 2 family protein
MDTTFGKFAVKLALSILILGFVLRSVETIQFWQSIRSIDIPLTVLAVLLFFPNQLLMAFRWYFLLKRLDRTVDFWSVVRHNTLGQFSALFLPGQISGDIVRTAAIAGGHSGKAVFALSVLIDKAVLIVALAGIALLGTLASPILSEVRGLLAATLFLLTITLATFVLLCRWRVARVPIRLGPLFGRVPTSLRAKHRSLLPIAGLPSVNVQTMCALLLLGISLQLVNTFGSFVLAQAMHIKLDPIEWAAINAIVAVAQILPLSIGGLGVREGVFAGLLSLYAVPAAQSIAYSLVCFVLVALLISLSWLVIESVPLKRFQTRNARISHQP